MLSEKTKNISNTSLFENSPHDYEGVKTLINKLFFNINIKEYCKEHGINYPMVINMLNNNDRNYSKLAIQVLESFNYKVSKVHKLLLFEITNTSQSKHKNERTTKTTKVGRATKTKGNQLS